MTTVLKQIPVTTMKHANTAIVQVNESVFYRIFMLKSWDFEEKVQKNVVKLGLKRDMHHIAYLRLFKAQLGIYIYGYI